MKKNCIDCHFIVYQPVYNLHRPVDGLQPLKDEIRNLYRNNSLEEYKKYFHATKHGYYIICAHGCWRMKSDIDTYQNPKCKGILFHKVKDGMAVSSVITLQKWEKDREAFKKSLKIASNSLMKAEESVNISKKNYEKSTKLVFWTLIITAIIGLTSISLQIFQIFKIPGQFFVVELGIIYIGYSILKNKVKKFLK